MNKMRAKERLRHQLNRRRSNSGSLGLVEVAISAGLMIIVVALAVDLTILNYAYCINDAACRDAARSAGTTSYATAALAAAAGNAGAADAVDAANAALLMHNTDGFFISQPQLYSTAAPYFVYSDLGWQPAAPTTSNVTVTTYVNVRLPVPLTFWGNNFSNLLTATGGKLQFRRSYTFPIIHENYTGG